MKIFAFFTKRQEASCSCATDAGNAKKRWKNAAVFYGEIVNSGAGEFLAQTKFGEIHGTMLGIPADEELPAGSPVEIFIRPELFHISDCPVDENCFPLNLEDAGVIELHDGVWLRRFRLPGDACICIAALRREDLALDDDAFAWALPEDVVAFLQKKRLA